MNATVTKPLSLQSLEAHVEALCRLWGPGYALAPVAHNAPANALAIRTPDQGLVAVELHGSELEFRATGWPQINDAGFKRSYAENLSAKISLNRDVDAAARDLERRLLVPYAAALTQARRKAADFRRLIADVNNCLDHAGFASSDRHVLGRSLQAQKPHGALDDNGKRVPTTSVTTITARDDSAVANVEVRSLSLPEVEALHDFISELIARRRPVLRLSA
jgi:hypothetical protein